MSTVLTFLVLLIVFAVWFEAVKQLPSAKPYWRHHFWIGVIIALIPGAPVWVTLLGVYIAIDDAYQHWRQVREPDYESPLHRLYEWVWVLVYRWIGVELP